VGYSTLLFLHVLGAFAMVAGAALFVAILLALRRHPGSVVAPRLVPAATVIWGVGSLAAILFGIWLAVHVRDYSITDGWILTAIVLWVIAGAIGGRISTGYRSLRGGPGAAVEGQAVVLHALLVLSVLLILIDMIYKPGVG
jgi:tellurite resistance protein TehA-like permease